VLRQAAEVSKITGQTLLSPESLYPILLTAALVVARSSAPTSSGAILPLPFLPFDLSSPGGTRRSMCTISPASCRW